VLVLLRENHPPEILAQRTWLDFTGFCVSTLTSGKEKHVQCRTWHIDSFCGIKGERNLQEKASTSIHLFPTMKFTLLTLLATAATTAYATAIEAREPAIADGVRTCSLYID